MFRMRNRKLIAENQELAAQLSAGLVQTIPPVIYSFIIFNDPSAGSPTETLLRLLVPLNDQV